MIISVKGITFAFVSADYGASTPVIEYDSFVCNLINYVND